MLGASVMVSELGQGSPDLVAVALTFDVVDRNSGCRFALGESPEKCDCEDSADDASDDDEARWDNAENRHIHPRRRTRCASVDSVLVGVACESDALRNFVVGSSDFL